MNKHAYKRCLIYSHDFVHKFAVCQEQLGQSFAIPPVLGVLVGIVVITGFHVCLWLLTCLLLHPPYCYVSCFVTCFPFALIFALYILALLYQSFVKSLFKVTCIPKSCLLFQCSPIIMFCLFSFSSRIMWIKPRNVTQYLQYSTDVTQYLQYTTEHLTVTLFICLFRSRIKIITASENAYQCICFTIPYKGLYVYCIQALKPTKMRTKYSTKPYTGGIWAEIRNVELCRWNNCQQDTDKIPVYEKFTWYFHSFRPDVHLVIDLAKLEMGSASRLNLN